MGRLRDALSRLRREMRGEAESFELVDGSRFYYSPQEVHKEVFLHGLECMSADSPEAWPPPPTIYVKLCQARHLEAVLKRLTSAEAIEFPYREDVLLRERRLVRLEYEPIRVLSE